MADRIQKRPDALRDQLNQAAAQIAIEEAAGTWPATAPTSAAVTAAANAIDTNLTNINGFEASLAAERQSRNTNTEVGLDTMRAVDEMTDALYGPDGAEKVAFGLPPKGSGSIAPLEKLVEIRTFDGTPPNSIRFDFENIEGSTYEVQWATDSAFTALVGSAVSTQSEYTISGLVAGTQYWMRVRPVRGGQTGPWSDPATRVAPV